MSEMHFKEFSVAQTIDISQAPFRRGRLDYSHLDNADILDAIAASVLLWGLTAVLIHISAHTFGMTTRSLVVRSLFEKFLIPDDHVFCKRCEKEPSRSQKNYYRTSQIAAFTLLTLLLLSEMLVVIFSSQSERYSTFEELKIKKLHFSSYDEDVRPVSIPPDCIRTLKPVPSVTISRMCICGVSWANIQKSGSRGVITITISRDRKFRTVNVSSQSASFSFGWIMSFEVHPDQYNAPLYFIDPMSIETNFSKLLLWTAQYIGDAFQCRKHNREESLYETSIQTQENANSVSLRGCSKGSSEEHVKMAVGLILSSLQLSDTFLRREDFSAPLISQSKHENRTSSEDYAEVWDRFAKYDTTLVPGYITWIIAMLFVLASLLLSGFVPDLQFVKVIAATQHLCLESVPSQLQKHRDLNRSSS